MRPTSIATIIGAALLVGLPKAYAWGVEGHALVAEIAESRLTPAAAAQVGSLLALDNHVHLDEIASWADLVRPERPESAPWHFVNIPLEVTAYNAARDCPRGACVVWKITDFAAILAGSRDATPERIEALKWLVHLAGDIEQPLHCVDHDDKGGNEVTVSYFGRTSRENLHHVWDTEILEHALGWPAAHGQLPDFAVFRTEAQALAREIRPADATVWAPPGTGRNLAATAIQWANESHALARDVAYGDLPSPPVSHGPPEILGGDYQSATWPVVQIQLERGGVRLAVVLNEALR